MNRVEAAWNAAAKKEWRFRMAALRDALPAEERHRKSERLCGVVESEILAPLRTRREGPLTVCAYGAFRSEADPLPLVRKCWSMGDTVAAPRIVGGRMEWRIVRDPSDWISGSWGVPEPDPGTSVPLPAGTAPDAVLVPGLAFHRDGGRLGYGGGYYDRMFAAEKELGRTSACWIGFALSVQLTSEALPKEPHDLDLDYIATDDGIIKLNGEGV